MSYLASQVLEQPRQEQADDGIAADIDSRVPVLSDDDLRGIVAEIETRGYAVVPNFLHAQDLARAQHFVAEVIARAPGGYTGFTTPEAVAGSGLDDLGASPVFSRMLKRIYQLGTGNSPPDQKFYQVLRCLTGADARVHSYLFHFDSYVLTMLVPLRMPNAGIGGDLLVLPNMRRVRKTYAANVLDKIVLDNAVTQWLLRTLMGAGRLKVTRIKMEIGSAYFFWGYRSVHTNEPCDADQVRATALYHFGNPHAREAA